MGNEVFNNDMRKSIGQVDRLLKNFLRRDQAGALVELAYADPIPYTKLVEAANRGETDYFLCRPDFEGPALSEMGDRIASEDITQARIKTAKRKDEFRRNSDQLSMIRSAFEIGPGTGEKIEYILRSQFGSQLQSIGFIDKQVAFTSAATKKTKEIVPNIQVMQLSQDIFQEAGRHKFSSRTLGMVLGGTISNVVINGFPNEKTEFPREQFVRMFDILSAYFSEEEGGSLLVSADTSDVKTMIDAYRDRPGTSYNADFSLGTLDFIEQLYEEARKFAPESEKDKYVISITSEDPRLAGKENISFRDIFRAEEKYFPKSKLSCHCAVVDYAATISIGKNGKMHTTHLEAGWYNATVISAKPRVEELAAAASLNGKFSFKDSTQNREAIDNQANRYRSVDVLRFDFNVARAAPTNKNDNSQPKTNGKMSRLAMVHNALSSSGGTVHPESFFMR